ncbi:MAG TPA: exosortase/archaeosortase family protein [Bryobacteraceae bacterium]|nr:exosortase/archaeosortase family protein [Bryobacteraceae bacterium]
MKKIELWVATVIFAVAILFFRYLEDTVRLALSDSGYLQILIAPFLCAFLIYWRRASIFANVQYSPTLGLPAVIISVFFCLFLRYFYSHTNLLLTQSALMLLLLSAFLLCYGMDSFRAALLPLSCLLLMIPAPPDWMEKISAGYQRGSAAVTLAIFKLTGTPVFREDMSFSLPGLNIEIARECSGIRSSLMFFIVGILTAGLYLRSGWRRFVLVAATIPISIVKNAVRIVSLSLLSIYVNRSFLNGPIHHQYGGILSMPVDFALFVPLVLALHKSEQRAGKIVK